MVSRDAADDTFVTTQVVTVNGSLFPTTRITMAPFIDIGLVHDRTGLLHTNIILHSILMRIRRRTQITCPQKGCRAKTTNNRFCTTHSPWRAFWLHSSTRGRKGAREQPKEPSFIDRLRVDETLNEAMEYFRGEYMDTPVKHVSFLWG